MSADDQKRAVGEAAAALVETRTIVGLGSGSTAAMFVEALGARVKAEGLDIRGVPTSRATAELAEHVGIPLAELDAVGRIDLTIDGADEIGPGLSLIKGGGAALLGEKLVWEASKRCVVVADASKRVSRLGAYPLPVEVVAFGHTTTARRIASVLGSLDYVVEPRLRLKGGEPLQTDRGNLIYDLACGGIDQPAALAVALKGLTGVVEHGLFLGLADEAIIAGPSGVTREQIHLRRTHG